MSDDLLDNCSLIGARRIADRLAAYWEAQGFPGIKTWVEFSGLPVSPRGEGSTDGTDWAFRSPHYVVKSNIMGDGYPPSVYEKAAA